jgi:hypothetical protein
MAGGIACLGTRVSEGRIVSRRARHPRAQADGRERSRKERSGCRRVLGPHIDRSEGRGTRRTMAERSRLVRDRRQPAPAVATTAIVGTPSRAVDVGHRADRRREVLVVRRPGRLGTAGRALDRRALHRHRRGRRGGARDRLCHRSLAFAAPQSPPPIDVPVRSVRTSAQGAGRGKCGTSAGLVQACEARHFPITAPDLEERSSSGLDRC